jgi:hypothetical protein
VPDGFVIVLLNVYFSTIFVEYGNVVAIIDQFGAGHSPVAACYADGPRQGQQASAPQRPSRTNE